jgi:HK97 family phage major capsid protein
MSKNVKSVSELITERNSMFAKREQINISMNAIMDKAQAEKRELSAEENVEYQKLQSDFAKLGRELALNADMVTSLKNKPANEKSANALLREALIEAKKSGKTEFVLQREITTAIIDEGGLIPVSVKDVVDPLEKGLIYGEVGIPVQTGVVGNIQWPILGSVEAEIVGETVELTDKTLDLSKINAKAVRVGISFTVSNQAINNSDVDLVALIQNQARMGMARTLNRVAFSHENFTGDFHGPFAGAKAQVTFAGDTPTLKELLALKGSVAGEGIQMIGFCYVMSEAMKAKLEGTSVDAGSGKMIIENGRVAGAYPVFTTEYINYGASGSKAGVEYIAAGVFAYLPLNQHGELRMVVDPYTQAKKDCVVITLNSDWSMTTLRKEAFALGKTTA